MTDLETADWLALPPPKTRAVRTRSESRAELAVIRRSMDLDQRRYLDTLAACRFHTSNADRLFNEWLTERGQSVNRTTLWRWRSTLKFKRAADIIAERIMKDEGPTPGKILLRVDELADYGAEDVGQFDRSGNPIRYNGRHITAKRDPHLALKASELLGKNHRLWGDDEKSSRVTVNIIDMTGRQALNDETPIIDGEAVVIENA